VRLRHLQRRTSSEARARRAGSRPPPSQYVAMRAAAAKRALRHRLVSAAGELANARRVDRALRGLVDGPEGKAALSANPGFLQRTAKAEDALAAAAKRVDAAKTAADLDGMGAARDQGAQVRVELADQLVFRVEAAEDGAHRLAGRRQRRRPAGSRRSPVKSRPCRRGPWRTSSSASA
jgi:hypothetical protein